LNALLDFIVFFGVFTEAEYFIISYLLIFKVVVQEYPRFDTVGGLCGWI